MGAYDFWRLRTLLVPVARDQILGLVMAPPCHAATVKPTAKSSATTPRDTEGAASNSPEAATRASQSSASPGKSQPTHACRSTESASHRPW
jgi:hypothetical protein